MKILTIVFGLIFASAIPGWTVEGTETVDPRELGKKLLARIDRLQIQSDAIENMIGDGKPYRGLAGKSVQVALDALDGSTGEEDVDFLAALNDCRLMDPTLVPTAITLEALLIAKRQNIDGIVRFIETLGINVAQLREDAEAERFEAAARTISTAPSQSDLFREDLYGNAERAKLLLLYLNRSNLGDFVRAQNGIRHNLSWGEPTKDQRLKAIFSAAGREYRFDNEYLWFGLIDILCENVPGVDINTIDGSDSCVKWLGYEDTWAINGHFRGTRNKETPAAVRSYNFNREASRLGVGRDVAETVSRLVGLFRR